MMLSRRQTLRLGLAGLLLALRPRLAFAAPEAACRVSPVLEWWCALARAAGFEEYERGTLPDWTGPLDRRLQRIAGHRVLGALQRARRNHGVSFDAIPSLASHLAGAPEAMRLRVPATPFPEELDDRWRQVDLDRLVALASEAAVIADFSGLLVEQSALVTRVEAALCAIVAEADLGWFEAFFGEPMRGLPLVLAGLSTGNNNYGARVASPERAEVWAVLGVSGTAEAPEIGGGLEVLIHEIGHDLVGALFDRHGEAFQAAGSRLFEATKVSMKLNNYGSWPTVVRESLLRAAVVHYVRAHQGEEAAAAALKDEADSGFRWVAGLDQALMAYEADRQRYPTLGEFVPELALALGIAADTAEARASAAPRLLSCVPAPGDRKVDPGLSEMVLTFDRPMKDPGWSIVGGGPKMPKVGAPRFDEGRTVWTAPITLQPGHDYELWLNSAQYEGFRAEDGTPLEPVHLSFSTRARP